MSKPKQKAKDKIISAAKRAQIKKFFTIIQMPEDRDDAPHWMFWLLIVVFILLVASVIWQGTSASSSLQAYLPYL